MDISFFIPKLTIGGAERTAVRLSNKLVDFGHCPELLVTTTGGELRPEVNDDVTITNLDTSNIFPATILNSVPYLVRYFNSASPDIFISFMKHANITALIAHWISGTEIPIVVNERNNISKDLRSSNPIRSRVIKSLMKYLYPRADSIIAISEGVATDLARTIGLDKKRIRTIYNPIDLENIEYQSEQIINHPWFDNNEVEVILSAGRLVPQKDFQTLISAFSTLTNKRNVRLIILGEGDQRAKLEKLMDSKGISEHVELPGTVKNPFPYMRKASVFVLSSAWEGLGNVLIEALACGCPVVATDCPSGPREILNDGAYGPLVPVGDPASLANAIETVLDDPLSKSHLKQRARRFSDDIIAEEYEDHFYTTIAKR